MFNRILVPLDGSRLAEQVFPPVTEIARAFGSQVVILGVCEPGNKEEEQVCQLYTDDQAKRLRTGFAGSSATSVMATLPGKPADQVTKYAQTNDVGLIVMTAHGRSGIKPWLGGTAQQVLRKAAVPLVVMRAGEPGEDVRLFDRIVVPLDGSDKSAVVLPYLVELAKRMPCGILPIRVTEPGKHVRTIGGLDYIRFGDRDLNSATAAAREHLDKVCAGFSGTRARVECEVRVGDAAQEILKFADEKDCTLLAMSSHGHSGIEGWAMGSVSAKVIQHSRHSVFLVPSFSQRPEY